MKSKSSLIFALSSLFSLYLLLICFIRLNGINVGTMLFWISIACLCESLPVYLSKERVVSVTFAVALSVQLSHGTYAATIVIAASSIFYLIKNNDGSYKHTLNLPFYKTMANFSNLTMTVFFSGLIYDYLLKYFNISISSSLSIAVVLIYLGTAFIFNSAYISMYFNLVNGFPFLKTWISSCLWALPNFLAIAPIGYFLYVLYQSPSGLLYILLLLGPLLLARYSFKLYLESKEQYYKTIKTLTAAIEAKDEYTEGHSRRVEEYASLIARKLKYPERRIESIKVAALLHDIGKIGIEDSILRKPGSLTRDEWEKIQQHPAIGMKILEEVALPKQVKDAILHHHERYDGKGYPNALKGDQISVDAYILSAADAYDAMTSDRPYRKAMSKETAIGIFEQEKGHQFHPEITEALLTILHEEHEEHEEQAEQAKKQCSKSDEEVDSKYAV